MRVSLCVCVFIIWVCIYNLEMAYTACWSMLTLSVIKIVFQFEANVS